LMIWSNSLKLRRKISMFGFRGFVLDQGLNIWQRIVGRRIKFATDLSWLIQKVF
jgi:hypothetical protein